MIDVSKMFIMSNIKNDASLSIIYSPDGRPSGSDDHPSGSDDYLSD
jgi:hypothetical protein